MDELAQMHGGVVEEGRVEYDLNAGEQIIDVKDDQQVLVHMFKTLAGARRKESFSQGTTALLNLALERFEGETALVLHPISETVCEVLARVGQADSFYIGQHITIESSLCGEVLCAKSPVMLKNFTLGSSQKGHDAYNGVRIGAYFGALVRSMHLGDCVLCVFSEIGKNVDYNLNDLQLIDLLAEGIACMIDLQNTVAKRNTSDMAAFADGSVKTLEEYLEQARIPEMLGVPARVLEVLNKRIGHQPLSISHIAEELNLSKRTLQRRLQQQQVNFAELRDQVRFHYSIDYLIKQHMSIDSISSSLDFSDRTSFTNAFKRWTGLSPSTFRKLFRDYV